LRNYLSLTHQNSEPPFSYIISVTIVVPAIVAGIIGQYQRETTSIEEKYNRRSAVEIDETYHQSYLTNLITDDDTYNDEIVKNNEVSGGPINLAGGSTDRDEDGLPNSTDPQPNNPDTDGDGTIDGQDPAPTNPGIGTPVTPAPTLPTGDTELVGELEIKNMYKNVRNLNQGATRWVNYTDAKPGDQLAFLIHFELINTSKTNQQAILSDFLNQYLRYAGSASVSINNQTQTITGESWMNGYIIEVPAGLTKVVEIRFNATAYLGQTNMIVLATNIARVTTQKNRAKDDAFVSINSYPVTQ
jgi:hypothetical protein